MASNFLIYGLVDPRDGEIRYVGQSSVGLLRPNQHRQPSFVKLAAHTPKGNWIAKLQRLGLDYSVEVLEEVASVEDLDIVESFWISQLRGMGRRLVNLTAGGKGNRGMPRSPEWRQKISAAQSGEKAHWFGKKCSRDERIKQSRAHGGRPVVDGNGVVYESLSDAARRTGFYKHHIRDAIRREGSLGGGQGTKGKGLSFKYLCPEGSDSSKNTPSGKE